MYILRPVSEKDLGDLVELSTFLDTVNFPNDEEKLQFGIEKSIRSFTKGYAKKNSSPKGVFQFVLEDIKKQKIIGVSKIIACHGTPKAPHYYWQISYDHRESKTIGIGLTHQVLKLGKDTRGHTEIAGIIVHPQFQGKQLGKQLFYIRFLYIALYPSKFLNRIISELLPPLDKDNRSALWEAYGRKFTGLTYQEADQLSYDNKEFIEALFPQNRIYTCLLPIQARQVIGKVGLKSLPVKHLAEKNGFEFLNQIDPFDGGPHYGCKTKDVLALKNQVTGKAKGVDPKDSESTQMGLVCKTKSKSLDFKAIQTNCYVQKLNSNELEISCPFEILDYLEIRPGESISFLPYT